MKKIECFKIMIKKQKSLFDMESGDCIYELHCDSNFGISEPTSIVADPFLFICNDTLYVFFEDKKLFRNGVISMIWTKDMANWSDPVMVLEEECHLSYPWVFEENGKVYMIPETSSLNSIRLYEGNADLTKFTYLKTILVDDEYEKDFSFSDSSIHKIEGLYYLFTTTNVCGENILNLYFSNNMFEGYEKHPCSPICKGNKFGRNAGSLFVYENHWYRVAQDCIVNYGNNVHLLEIVSINKKEYKEVVVRENLFSNKQVFFKEGGHQFNWLKYKDEYYVAVDSKEYHSYFLFRFLRRFLLFWRKIIRGKD